MKKYWIVVRNRWEKPAKGRRFKRHATLSAAAAEAKRLCEEVQPELHPSPSFRVFECLGEFKRRKSGVILNAEARQ